MEKSIEVGTAMKRLLSKPLRGILLPNFITVKYEIKTKI